MKKSEKQARRALVLYGIAAALVLSVIYGQSMLNAEESGNFSGFVMTFLKPLLDPSGRFDPEEFHLFLRKAGHFAEYTALGVCAGGMAANYGYLKQRRFLALPMLATLAVAVSDEFLQSFTGRGSAVADVVLDYAGALFGLGLMGLFQWITGRKQRRNENEA